MHPFVPFLMMYLLIDKKLEGVLLFTLCDTIFQIIRVSLGEKLDIVVHWSLFQLVFERVEPSVG